MMKFNSFYKLCQLIESHDDSSHDSEVVEFVLLLEDKRFYSHNGVDLVALFRAIIWWCIGQPKGGASTIDMQLVRTVTDRKNNTFKRKLIEIIIALIIRRRYRPESIIRCYLSIAYTGYNLEGLEAACFALFNRDSSLCSNREKAINAAVLLHPVPIFRSLDWSCRINKRANLALARRLKSG